MNVMEKSCCLVSVCRHRIGTKIYMSTYGRGTGICWTQSGGEVRICLTYNISVGEKLKKYINGVRSGAHAFNPSTWEVEVDRSL